MNNRISSRHIALVLAFVLIISVPVYSFDFYQAFSDFFGTSQKITGFVINPTTITVSYSPLTAKTTDTVTINSDASDADGINSILIYVDGNWKKTCTTPGSVTTASLLDPYTSYSCSYGQTHAAGTHTYFARAVDKTGVTTTSSTGSFSVASEFVQPCSPTIATSSLPSGTVNTAYTTTQLSSSFSGSCTSLSWSVVNPVSFPLPPGLSLSSSGVISGTPTTPGVYSFTVKLADSSGTSATQSFSISIGLSSTPCTLSISTSSLPLGTVGSSYQATLLMSPSGACKMPYVWSIYSGSLPPGLGLSSDGAISGAPTTAGTYYFNVKVRDSSSPAVSTLEKPFSIIISSVSTTPTDTTPPQLSNLTVTPTSIATSGSTQYVTVKAGATDDSSGVKYVEAKFTSSSSIALTSNYLSFVQSSGKWEGAIPFPPLMSYDTGTWKFDLEIRISDNAGNIKSLPASQLKLLGFTDSIAYTGPCSLSIASSNSLLATVGTPYSATFSVSPSGSCGSPYAFSFSSLPSGLQALANSITGTPTTAGTSKFTVQVTDTKGNQASKEFTITVGTSATTPDNPTTITVSHSSTTTTPTTTDTVTIKADAKDADGINSILIYVDGNWKKTCTASETLITAYQINPGTSYSCSYGQTYAAGTHTYFARAVDKTGVTTTSSTGSFTVSSSTTTPPTVSIKTDKSSYSLNEEVKLTVRITANANIINNIILNSITVVRPNGAKELASLSTIQPPGTCEVGTTICYKTYFGSYSNTNLAGSYSAAPSFTGLPPETGISGVIFNVGTADTTPPILNTLSITPTSIDVSRLSATVTVNASVLDDSSGAKFVEAYLSSPSGQQNIAKNLSLISGTANGGLWSGTLTFPAYSEAGTWKLHVNMQDNANNLRYLSPSDLQAAGFSSSIAVVSASPDTTPPTLTGLNIEPRSIVSSIASNVVVTANVMDQASGVSGMSVSFNHYTGLEVSTQSFYLSGGTANSGTWKGTIRFPASTPTGDWYIGVTLTDNVGNVKYYKYYELPQGSPKSVYVSPYTKPPEVKLLSPENGAALIADTPITFSCSAQSASELKSIELVIRTSEQPNLITESKTVSGTSATASFTKSFSYSNSYQYYWWYCTAQDLSGMKGYGDQRYFTLQPKPDWSIDNIQIQTTTPSEGSDIAVSVLAKASGLTGTSEKPYVALYDEAGSSLGKKEISFSTLSASFVFQMKSGAHTLKAVIDPDNKIVESNENNNQLSKAITVSGPAQIKVTSPAYGDEWKKGETYRIKWEAPSFSSSPRYIKTISDFSGESISIGSSGTLGVGYYDWEIPKDFKSGRFKVRVGAQPESTGAYGESNEFIISPDTTAPKLTNLRVTPTSIDTTRSEASVDVEATVKDDLSGVRWVNVWFVNPSGSQGIFADLKRDGATDVWKGKAIFPRYSEPGEWKISASAYDIAYNNMYLTPEQLPAGSPRNIIVTSLWDNTGPELVQLTIDPPSIDVSESDKTADVAALITDDLSGVEWVNVQFKSPSGSKYIYTYLRRDGTTDIWKGKAPFPQYSEAGTWKISADMWDKINNHRQLDSAQIPSGSSTGITVFSSKSDTSAPVLISLMINPTSIDTRSSEASVDVEATVRDDLSGVHRVGVWFASPSWDRSFAQLTRDGTTDTWKGVVTFPQNSEGGTWKISADMLDNIGNYRYLDSTQLPPGSPTSINVVGVSRSGFLSEAFLKTDKRYYTINDNVEIALAVSAKEGDINKVEPLKIIVTRPDGTLDSIGFSNVVPARCLEGNCLKVYYTSYSKTDTLGTYTLKVIFAEKPTVPTATATFNVNEGGGASPGAPSPVQPTTPPTTTQIDQTALLELITKTDVLKVKLQQSGDRLETLSDFYTSAGDSAAASKYTSAKSSIDKAVAAVQDIKIIVSRSSVTESSLAEIKSKLGSIKAYVTQAVDILRK